MKKIATIDLHSTCFIKTMNNKDILKEFEIKIDWIISTWKDEELKDELIGIKNIVQDIVVKQETFLKAQRDEIIKDMDKLSIKDFNKKWNCNIK